VNPFHQPLILTVLTQGPQGPQGVQGPPGDAGSSTSVTVTDIDATNTGAVALFTASAPQVILYVILIPTTFTAITTPPTVSIGANLAADDIFTDTDTFGIASGRAYTLSATGPNRILDTSDVAKINIQSAAVGTAMLMDVIIVSQFL
jgi:hypothetical protein